MIACDLIAAAGLEIIPAASLTRVEREFTISDGAWSSWWRLWSGDLTDCGADAGHGAIQRLSKRDQQVCVFFSTVLFVVVVNEEAEGSDVK